MNRARITEMKPGERIVIPTAGPGHLFTGIRMYGVERPARERHKGPPAATTDCMGQSWTAMRVDFDADSQAEHEGMQKGKELPRLSPPLHMLGVPVSPSDAQPESRRQEYFYYCQVISAWRPIAGGNVLCVFDCGVAGPSRMVRWRVRACRKFRRLSHATPA